MDFLSAMRHLVLLWGVFVLLVTSAGCQQRAASKLQGRWEGRPESAASRAVREAEKYGNTPQANANKINKPSEEGFATTRNFPEQTTDWENYEVTIHLNFVSSERLEMSLDGGEQKRSADWQVVSTLPTSCIIEVQTEETLEETRKTNEGTQETKRVRRRFELVFDERDGTCVGFLLTEMGADRLLGTLYFQRPESAGSASSNEEPLPESS